MTNTVGSFHARSKKQFQSIAKWYLVDTTLTFIYTDKAMLSDEKPS